MERVKLDRLKNIIIRDTGNSNCFIGFNVIKKKDINDTEYELKNNEDKYYYLDKLGDNSIFVSESYLLDALLSDYIKNIESNDIYEHGYPESRLVPSNHYESCQESYLEYVLNEVSEKVSNVISSYF